MISMKKIYFETNLGNECRCYSGRSARNDGLRGPSEYHTITDVRSILIIIFVIYRAYRRWKFGWGSRN